MSASHGNGDARPVGCCGEFVVHVELSGEVGENRPERLLGILGVWQQRPNREFKLGFLGACRHPKACNFRLAMSIVTPWAKAKGQRLGPHGGEVYRVPLKLIMLGEESLTSGAATQLLGMSLLTIDLIFAVAKQRENKRPSTFGNIAGVFPVEIFDCDTRR